MAKIYNESDPSFSTIPGMDPAADWLLGEPAANFLPDGSPIPFLMELGGMEAVRAFLALPPVSGEIDEPTPLPGEHDGEFDARFRGNGTLVFTDFKDIAPGRPLPVLASREWFEKLRVEEAYAPFRRAAKRIVLSTPMQLHEHFMRDYPDFPLFLWGLPRDKAINPPEGGWPKCTVVTAVIDDGLPFAHERLRDSDGATRVHAYWDMNMFFNAPPNPPPFGELNKAEIDAHLLAAGPVDEDAIYLAERLTDFSDARHKALAWRIAHGAGVVDLAAGYEPSEDRRDRPVIAVQLPTDTVARTNGDLLEFHLGFAIAFILDRARRMSEPGALLPVVINTSFGFFAGAHDGDRVFERALDWWIKNSTTAGFGELRMVIPAGNAHLSRCHAVVDLQVAESVTFDWIIRPNDRTGSVLEIWLPPEDGVRAHLALSLTPPFAPAMPIDETTVGPIDVNGASGLKVAEMVAQTAPNGRTVIRVTTFPTERMQPTTDLVSPAGAWTINFTRSGNGTGPVAHAWVQRDDTLYGYPQSGRQSYLDHPDYAPVAVDTRPIVDDAHADQGPCPVTRASLTNAIATGAELITAGGYFERTCEVAPYSAGGPNTPAEVGAPVPVKPDALMPSEGSPAHRGMLAAGSRSGARSPQNGTSVAAPQLARFVVEEIAIGNATDRASIAQRAEHEDVCKSAPRPKHRGGRGSLPRPDLLPVARYEP